MGKRQLGLGKAAKSKKQKSNPADVQSEKQESLTVELNEEADADDEFAQLQALWKTYSQLDKDNELMVNGVIHECDRLLRNSEKPETLPQSFHAVYALALAELAKFKPEETNEWFQASLERLDTVLEKAADSIDLNFAKCLVLLARIPLQYISCMETTAKIGDIPDLAEMLDTALAAYEVAEAQCETKKDYARFNTETMDILQALDDVLDMVDNFCKVETEEKEEKEDEDEDYDDDDEDEEVIQLAEDHPLHGVQNNDKYNQWWRDHTVQFLKNVANREDDTAHLERELCARLGQSYLQEAETPGNVYTTLKYDDDYAGLEELEGLTINEAQNIAQKCYKQALEYLKKAQDSDDPDTWVLVAEAMISLGNIYDMESPEQERWYSEAEAILVRANKATQGRYAEILANLREQ